MTRITVEKSVKRGNIAGVKWDDDSKFVAELNGEEDISEMVDTVFGLFILLGYTPHTVYESFHDAANNCLEGYWPEHDDRSLIERFVKHQKFGKFDTEEECIDAFVEHWKSE